MGVEGGERSVFIIYDHGRHCRDDVYYVVSHMGIPNYVYNETKGSEGWSPAGIRKKVWNTKVPRQMLLFYLMSSKEQKDWVEDW